MKVWLVFEEIPYEGDWFVGAADSPEYAEEMKAEYITRLAAVPMSVSAVRIDEVEIETKEKGPESEDPRALK